jgi:T5SS/PEP-CTERM-associated repeat protein
MTQSFSPKSISHLLALSAFFVLGGSSLHAATQLWQGTGADGDWTTSGNFSPGTVLSTDDLQFDGNNYLTTNNNSGAFTDTVNSLTFNAGAGAFSLEGTNSLTLQSSGTALANLSANLQTVNINTIYVGNNQTWSAGTGGLQVDSDVVINTGGSANSGLTITGSGDTTINGDILESSNAHIAALVKDGTGALTLTGANNLYHDYTLVKNGSLTITGGLTGTSSVQVGNSNNAAYLFISGGGTVSTVSAALGISAGANNNQATVEGTGSKLTLTGDLNVGFLGSNNTFTINTGGTVSDDNTKIGGDAAATFNSIHLDGTGSSLTNTNDLTVGYSGNHNSFQITNGATASNVNAFLGFNSGADSNSVTVDGTGSVWTNTGTFYLGDVGKSNSLTVSGGGVVNVNGASQDAAIGFDAASSSNKLTVTGTGSKFANASTLYVGDNGSSNTMDILLGGLVTSRNARIGGGSTSNNNTATVDGTGSSWTGTGTLRVGSNGSNNALNITNGGNVNFAGNNFVGYSSTSTGNTVTVDGAGSQWTAGTTGSLTIGNSGAGTVTVKNGGALTTTAVTLAAALNSSGTLNIGGGALAGTVTSPGAITGGAGTASVIFAETDSSYTFATTLAGTLSVTQSGSGTTLLTGTNIYSGGTTVSAGVLKAGPAALGTGNMILSGGTLATASFPANLNVGGTYTQTGGTLRLALDSPLVHDNLIVTGTAALGGRLQVVLNPGFNSTVSSTTDLIQTGGLNGTTFTSLSLVGVSYSRASLLYSTTDVSLVLTRLFLSQTPGLTANQFHVAANIDALVGNPDPSFGNLVNALYPFNGNSATLGYALDQLTPLRFESFASSNAFNNSTFTTQQIDNYLANHRGADGTFVSSNGGIDSSGLMVSDPSIPAGLRPMYSRLLAWSPAPSTGLLCDAGPARFGLLDTKSLADKATPPETHPWNMFVSGDAIFGQGYSDNAKGISHTDSTTGAVQIGADYRIDPHWLAGALFSYAHTDATLDTIGSKANVSTYSPGVYAAYSNSGWYANALASYGLSNYDQDRHVALPGFGGTANSTPNGTQLLGNLSTGYDFHSGPWTYGPTIGAQFVHLDLDGYTETGLPGANLTVSNNQSDSLRSRLGGRVSYAIQSGSVIFTPHLSVAWLHEFMDRSRGVSSEFSGLGGGAFVVTTSRPDRETGLVDLGLDAQLNNTVTLTTGASAQGGQNNYFGVSAQLGLKIGF